MNETKKYTAGYIFGFGVFIILIPLGFYGLSRFDYLFDHNVLIGSTKLRNIISLVLLLVGAFFAIWSNIFLAMVGKGGPTEGFGIAISPPTKKLVTTGPYAYSRNPMVFGAFTLYASWVLYLNSVTGLICLLVLLFVAIGFLKFSEEKRLVRDFGDEYINYRKRVSMIFPLIRFRL
jgi:protein-S-isoprenylcysteine O-methyltransferase Ste14